MGADVVAAWTLFDAARRLPVRDAIVEELSDPSR
jgi:hypothetical protein